MKKIEEGTKTALKCMTPACNGSLVIRQNRKQGNHFLGCENYPVCRYTRPLPEDTKMQMAGAPKLPGF